MDKFPQNILPTTHATPSTKPLDTNRALFPPTTEIQPIPKLYTDGSFIPPDDIGNGNLTGLGVYSQLNNIQIA